MNDAAYTYCIFFDSTKHVHIGLCVEFPDLHVAAGDPNTTLELIRARVRQNLDMLQTTGGSVPMPIGERPFRSGFRVVVPNLDESAA